MKTISGHVLLEENEVSTLIFDQNTLDQRIFRTIHHVPTREFILQFLRIRPLSRKDFQQAIDDTFFQV